MEPDGLIPVGEKHLIQQSEGSTWFYDVYQIKVTPKHPDGKLDNVCWGVPLERALDIIAHRESIEESDTIQKLIDRIIASRKELTREIKELLKK